MFLGAAGATTACSMLPPEARNNSTQPNIVFILADDMGWGDLACYGREDVRTPNIDSLARDGVRFTNSYSSSATCSPTRVSLMTGQYHGRFPAGLDEPIPIISDAGLEVGVPTLPNSLKKLGYQTSLVGKWHLGSLDKYSPLKHGYDHFWGFRGGAVDYFTHDFKFVRGDVPTSRPDLWDGDTRVEETGYLTNLIGDRSVNELTRMASSEAPFFLSVHFTAPHWPWEDENDEQAAQKIRHTFHSDGGTQAKYASMIGAMDRNVGEILNALKRSGHEKSTIVIFTSDNGGERFSKIWPFTGMKGELLEGGIRTPLLVRWPGTTPKGVTHDTVASTMDWFPTLLSAAGMPREQQPPNDGIDLGLVMSGAPDLERSVFWRHRAHGQAAVRRGKWKYLKIAGSEFLFDIEADPQERGNLKSHYPDVFEELKNQWAAWNTEMLSYPDDSSSVDNCSHRFYPDRYC